MTRHQFTAFATILALSLFAAPPGRAGTSGYDLGLLRTGMPLADLRHAAWPTGSRLLCTGDADLPANLVTPAHERIDLPERLAKSGVVACALFAANAKGVWESKMIEFGGAPARLWVLALAETAGDEAHLVQARLWQAEEAYTNTVSFVTGRLGQGDYANKHGARWSTDTSEAIVGHQSDGGISTILTDKSLEKQVNQRLSSENSQTKTEAKP